jgi:hypothetical protein
LANDAATTMSSEQRELELVLIAEFFGDVVSEVSAQRVCVLLDGIGVLLSTNRAF